MPAGVWEERPGCGQGCNETSRLIQHCQEGQQVGLLPARGGREEVLSMCYPLPCPSLCPEHLGKVQQITEIWFIARPAKMIKNALCHLSKFKHQRLPGENRQNPGGLQGPTHANVRAGSAQVLGRDTAMLPHSPQPRAVDLRMGSYGPRGHSSSQVHTLYQPYWRPKGKTGSRF